MANALFFVSKRLQKIAAAVLCLMLAQIAFSAAAHAPRVATVGVRVAITR